MKQLTSLMQAQLLLMAATGKLFRSSATGEEIYDTYLKGFEPEHNPVFRDPASSEHNCNHCNNFIRRYGNIVAISPETGDIMTIFDVSISGEYHSTTKAMSKLIKSKPIKDVFFETYNELNSLPYEKCSKSNSVFRLGIDSNPKRYTKEEAEKFLRANGDFIVKPGEDRMFNHFYLDLPKEFVDMSGDSIATIMGRFRDSKHLLQRGMEEIPLDTLNLVVDLISQGSLLNGETYLSKVKTFINLKKEYDSIPVNKRDNWCWVMSYKLPIAGFKNELIGTFCTELAEGKELNAACKAWNIRVDPVNYMKVTAPITKKQIEEAKKFVEENGYTDSFTRRTARLQDIKVSEIKHINSGSGKIKSASIFDKVPASSSSTRHKRSEFDGLDTVPIEKFMTDILPGCTSIEAFLRNDHEGNMVTLTTADNPDSKPIFKWDNNYSWSFNGNLAGKSMIKSTVASKGGKVDGVLRFSAVWNEKNGADHSDLDLWCLQPDSVRIGFSEGYRKDSGGRFSSCSGQLDVDDRGHSSNIHAENIYFGDLKKMKNGVYKFWINQFSARNSKGFKAEIEFDGEIYSYEYNRPVSGDVQVAEVTLKDGVFSIVHKLPESTSSKEIYGLQTGQFHKVNLVCLSPNYWGENNVGHKHYIFGLEGCKCPEQVRTFHNENLNSELLAHRKVMDVLGSTCMVTPDDDQVSGLGFNATVRDEVILKLSGTHKRTIKVTF